MEFCFNSTLVQLKGLTTQLGSQHFLSFNSTLVQLKVTYEKNVFDDSF